MKVVTALLMYGAGLEQRDCSGETAVTLAVWVNSHEIVRLLARRGARLDVVTDAGRTVLHTAAQYGDLAMVETLLDLSLGTTRSTAFNAEGLTALEKLKQRKDLTPELTEAFVALLLKTDSGNTTARDCPSSTTCVPKVEDESSDSESDVFLEAMEKLEV
jgi:ankyrin repeat protein